MAKKTYIPNSAALAALALALFLTAWAFSGAAFAAADNAAKTRSLRTAPAGGATYAMNSSAEVRRDTLYLSDFLSASVSPWLRARAARVPLGDAPVPGARRQIERAEIDRDLRSFPDVRATLAVPAVI
ncbi:MAG: hypothetical protein ACRD4M_09015, partial [Candidatus Acidiferrales bacterium]